MKKRSAPPLYELIGTRAARAGTPVEHDQHGPAADVGPGQRLGWLEPGRYLQIPVGYIFVASALIVLLAALAYMVGHSRGYGAAKAAAAEELEATHLADERRRPSDPLDRHAATTADTAQQPTHNRPATTPQRQTAAGGTPAGWGPIQSDPRQEGMNYFVLATTTPEGALRLAEFCRQRGLETYVVSGNNARLRRVIALPGFESGQRTSQPTREVEALIHRIGESWSKTEPGATDLRDTYPELYRGSRS